MRATSPNSLCITLLAFLSPFGISCSQSQNKGSVLLHSPGPGTYEIYRASDEDQLQFVAEEIGHFNEPLSLDPGSYLILADCSSVSAVVLPGRSVQLFSHQVQFETPNATPESGQLSVQCDRLEKTRSRQNLSNRFQLTVLEGEWDILVGMVPIHLSMPKQHPQAGPIKFPLSSLEVRDPSPTAENVPFFVSPTEARVAITTPEAFNKRVFLLPGNYNVEVNGTQRQVSLGDRMELVLEPGYLRVSTPEGVDLELSSRVRGNPSYVEINDGNWLNLNETYAVLPGTIGIKLNDSEEVREFQIEAGKLLDMQVRAVRVDLNCSPWEWNCLGSKRVYLYKENQPYPFANGVTDVPILFYENDVWIGLEGSRDLRYRIPNERSVVLGTWKLNVKPEIATAPNRMTDLLRLESTGMPFVGHTLDMSLDADSSFDLIRGPYYLTSYHRQLGNDGARQRQRKFLAGNKGDQIEISATVFLTEKRYAEYVAKREQQQKAELSRLRQSAANNPNHARRWRAQ